LHGAVAAGESVRPATSGETSGSKQTADET
jgi:hypothetical protein